MKEKLSWYSERLQQEMPLVRWGVVGQPVLLFPTAGGDCEEIERMQVVDALAPLLEAGRIKVYSVDSVATRIWHRDDLPASLSAKLQNAFDGYVYHEVVAAIREDCRSPTIEVVAAGSSIGAFNALASVCRHPDVFSRAICLSGTYDVERFIKGQGDPGTEFHFASPRRFLPFLGDGPLLDRLRKRFVLFAHGKNGRWESPEQDWGMASILGSKGVPNRVDAWGDDFDHNWPTWRAMLPQYLAEV